MTVHTPTRVEAKELNPLAYRSLFTITKSVLDESTRLAVANPLRKYLLLVNDSDTVIYVNFGKAASLNAGVRLNASGGSYEMSEAFGNLTGQEVTAICSVAAKNVLVVEG